MIDYPSSSPPLASETFSEEIDSFSLQDNNVFIQHNNNNINKTYLSNGGQNNISGVRGHKTFAFWVLVGLLFTLAIGNLLLTITILGVLKMGQGMQSMEIIDKENASNFYGNIDLDHLYNREGIFKGFSGESVDVSSLDGSILLNLVQKSGGTYTKLKMFKNYTFMKGINSFIIRNHEGIPILRSSDTIFESLNGANGFITKQMETNHIRSAKNEDLVIESDTTINLKGTEGTKIESREIVWSADEDIYLKTENGCIILSGKEGTYIDINRIPLAQLRNNTMRTGQYKICVCMPEGKLFRIPVLNAHDPVYCDDVDVTTDFPCSLKE